MPSCVSEESYIFIFIIALVSLICFLISTVIFYDKFNKATVNLLNQKQANTARSLSIIFMTLSVIFLCILFIAFFGFSKKITYNIK